MTKPIEIPEAVEAAARFRFELIREKVGSRDWEKWEETNQLRRDHYLSEAAEQLQAALPHLKAAWEQEIRERLLSEGVVRAIYPWVIAEDAEEIRSVIAIALSTALEQEEES